MISATDDTEAEPKDIDAVIRKIQKILSKTKGGRGATDEESDTAMRIAQELMSKYNLDMATISAGSSPDNVSVERVDERLASRSRFKWQRDLAKYVAEANFCLHIILVDRVRDENGYPVYGADGRKMRRTVHRFIGRKANVITTQLMFEYLCRTIDENAPARDGRGLTKAISSWKEGCAAKVCERLAARRQDLMAEHDARVKAEEAAFQADVARRSKEAKEKASRVLRAREATPEEVVENLSKGARRVVGFKSSAPSVEPVRPEAAKDDWTPGDGAEPEPEVAPAGTSLVLASVYDQREQELNNDVRRGWDPGTTTRMRLENEEWQRKWEEKQAAREATEGNKEEEWAPENKTPETERQRERRIKRQAKEHAAWRRKWARDDERAARREAKEYARLDHDAFHSGMKTGEKIGLDPQVKARADAKRLGGK